MSIDVFEFCGRCGCVLYPEDKQYKISYKISHKWFGEIPADMFLCESCFQALLEEQAKKSEADAREKKRRKFWFFGGKKDQKGDKYVG